MPPYCVSLGHLCFNVSINTLLYTQQQNSWMVKQQSGSGSAAPDDLKWFGQQNQTQGNFLNAICSTWQRMEEVKYLTNI